MKSVPGTFAGKIAISQLMSQQVDTHIKSETHVHLTSNDLINDKSYMKQTHLTNDITSI